MRAIVSSCPCALMRSLCAYFAGLVIGTMAIAIGHRYSHKVVRIASDYEMIKFPSCGIIEANISWKGAETSRTYSIRRIASLCILPIALCRGTFIFCRMVQACLNSGRIRTYISMERLIDYRSGMENKSQGKNKQHSHFNLQHFRANFASETRKPKLPVETKLSADEGD